jgi:hypothetical protein
MSAMGCKHWAKGLLCTHKPQHTHTHPRHTAVEGSMAHKSHRIRVDFFFELVGAFQRLLCSAFVVERFRRETRNLLGFSV